MAGRLAIFHPPGVLESRENPFGKDVANLELYRALARHAGFGQVDLLSLLPSDETALREALLEGRSAETRIVGGSALNTAICVQAGALLRGQPYLYELSWLRRRGPGDAAYSLLGLAHTIGPPAVRQLILNASLGPTHPWDAIICTSPAVRDALTALFQTWGGHLAERTGGQAPCQPMLPIVPLGVDGAALAARADRPRVRASRRAALGVGDDAVLVLWVGRLSYFEKAFPQPMFRALQRAHGLGGKKLHFAMAGWFPSEPDRARYEQAAAACAPDVPVSFLDGNDRELLGELWAAADIFLSLVDNIQETFGIAPVEAMAAGLPVVASDWDGYRYTMRDGVEAILVPSLGGPAGGLGYAMAQRHQMLLDSYQAYVGAIAQHTAVHVGRAAEALAALAGDPDLRRRMGAAGRARVAEAFDWPVVARQYASLIDELAAIRAAAPPAAAPIRGDPAAGDPFADFAGFATQAASLDLPLRASPGLTGADVVATAATELDRAFPAWRGSLEEAAQAFELVAQGRATSVKEVLLAFPPQRRRAVELSVMWLAKQGFLDWLA